MKNSIFTFVIVLVAQMGFASELDSILNKARALSNNKEYTEAIIVYENYIKVSKGENLKEVYIEIANCYFYQGKKQEAVNNIEKHAEASVINVVMEFRKDVLSVTVEDNGKGFDTAENVGSESFGLLGMRERINLLNGELHIKSIKGTGTKIAIKVNLK